MKKGGADAPDIVLQREIFVANRKEAIEEFRHRLTGKTKFAKLGAIRYVVEQERFVEYITKIKHLVAKPKEEQKILEMLIAEAKTAFGKEYDELRKELKDNG